MPGEFEQNVKELTTDLKRILTNRGIVLKGAYERDIIYYKTMISTHEVTIGQQNIELKEKNYYIAELESRLYELEFGGDKVDNNEPIPYPYTNPIRELSTSSRIKR